MNEEKAFKSLFDTYCEAAGLVKSRGYPLYEITDGFSKINVRILDPFVEAELENRRKIRSATPKRVLEIVKKELAKKRKMTKKEDDVLRFSRILLSSAQQVLLLINSPMRILKIRTLLGIIKSLYSRLRIEVDELGMFNEALNSGLLNYELFPGRGPADTVEITLPEGKKKCSLIRFRSFELGRGNERKTETSV